MLGYWSFDGNLFWKSCAQHEYLLTTGKGKLRNVKIKRNTEQSVLEIEPLKWEIRNAIQLGHNKLIYPFNY